MTKASCSECPSTYELVPPPDPEYSEPKERPTSDDNIKRVYECEEGHRNTVYWEKKEFFVESAKFGGDPPDFYSSTKYGRSREMDSFG